MKHDRHLFESFTSFTSPPNSAMAEILYYVVRYIYIRSIELEDSQAWLCIQHTRNIVYVGRERRANGRHGASPTTFTEVEVVQGLMAPKVREFKRVFREKQINPCCKGETENEGDQAPGATPDWELTSVWSP